jgi:hypothetical protein
VFVSNAHGNDVTGNGTKESPYASITKGLSSAAGKKVFVCLGLKGDYTDELSFNGSEDVSIYGGFECDSWEYSTTRKAGIKPAKNIALRINNSKNLTFENLRIMAADATGKDYDASSYGAFVTDSSGVVFRRVEITAGKGAKGADGEPGVKGADGAGPDVGQVGEPGKCDGAATADGVPGKWPAAVCGGTRGGSGGIGVLDTDGGSGASGIPSTNVTPPNVKNLGAGATSMGVEGDPGKAGSAGTQGSLGESAPQLGTFSASGYVAASGNAGTDGFPGQGGGGGGASLGRLGCRGASGGAGGMGGCGGGAGSGGMGGGASVGVMSVNSGVALESCTVKSTAAGMGGGGGNGGGLGVGGSGGDGGAPDGTGKVARGGKGGAGGNGGIGGSGSGGTGGASYALVFAGTKPLYVAGDTTLTPGDGGAAGPGGQVDAEAPKAPDGAEGISGIELEIQ